MYNDYYLQQINDKLQTQNGILIDLEDNQEIIIQQQQEMISGDNMIISNTEKIMTGTYVVAMIGIMFMIYYFIMRCLR